MYSKVLENGNVVIEKSDLLAGTHGLADLVVALCDSIDLDFILQKDAMIGCSSYVLYNCYTQLCYVVDIDDAYKFDSNETVTLVGFSPLEVSDRKYFEKLFDI